MLPYENQDLYVHNVHSECKKPPDGKFETPTVANKYIKPLFI